MPDITLPHTFIDTTVTNASQIEENIFRAEVTPPTSLSVINGRLDNNNRQAGWDIERQHIQRGALSSGRTIGSTTNHTYFEENFKGWDPTTEDKNSYYQIIPGAAQTFYLPFTPSLVVFTWSIFSGLPDSSAVVPSSNGVTKSKLRLFIDGARIGHKIAPELTTRGRDEFEFSRHWAGHYFWNSGPGLVKGWHSAGLGLAISADLANVRVKRFDYVYFR